MPLPSGVEPILKELGISDKLVKKAGIYYDMTRDRGGAWATAVKNPAKMAAYIRKYAQEMGVPESRAREFAETWSKKMQTKAPEDWQSAVDAFAAASFAIGVAGVEPSEDQIKRLMSAAGRPT